MAETSGWPTPWWTGPNGLLAAVQVVDARPGRRVGLAAEARRLAALADQFHDAIDPNQPPQGVAQAFLPVDECADRLERFIVNNNDAPPPVQIAWQAFASVEVLMHQNLGLASPQPAVPVNIVAPPADAGPSPVVGPGRPARAADHGVRPGLRADRPARPRGAYMLADAQQLQAAAANFRQDAAGNLAPNQLAYEFRDVDAVWHRLARRVNRIARGRLGPNIAAGPEARRRPASRSTGSSACPATRPCSTGLPSTSSPPPGRGREGNPTRGDIAISTPEWAMSPHLIRDMAHGHSSDLGPASCLSFKEFSHARVAERPRILGGRKCGRRTVSR